MSVLDNFFGFKFLRKTEDNLSSSLTAEATDDGSFPISAVAGYYGTFVDIDGLSRTESELVRRYREISLYPDVDVGIQDIVNEAICEDDDGNIVFLNLDKANIDPKIKHLITKEFETVLDLLDFYSSGSDIFRRWYVDGKIYYQIIFDKKNIKRGIVGLKNIDSVKMKKVVEYDVKKNSVTGTDFVEKTDEYFLFSENGFGSSSASSSQAISANATNTNYVKVSVDSILYANSGLIDSNTQNVLSHLHKAIKPANQLRMIEDAAVIYRLSRASERRVFKIPVGHLPKTKQEAYLRDTMLRFRNKVVYDSATGDVRNDKKFMSLQEDFWLPVYGDGKATDISTLPAATNLDQIKDLSYFQNKLYQALNVPYSRLATSEKVVGIGRTNEITRDELKFSKFVDKLRRKFSTLILDALKVQCILKGILTIEEWDSLYKKIRIEYAKDNNFVELKEMELLNDRLDLFSKIDGSIGTYFSRKFVYKKIFDMDDEEIKEMESQIQKELVFNAKENKPVPTSSSSIGAESGFGGGEFGGMGAPDLGAPEGTEGEAGGETPEAPETPEGEVTLAPQQ